MVKKTTFNKWVAMFCLLLASGVAFAQTVTGMAPSNVTHRTTVTLSGTGFSSTSTVRFYTGTDNTAASTAYVLGTGVTYNSANGQLTVTVPAVTAAGSGLNTRSIRVFNGTTAGAAYDYSYTAPAQTPAVAGITRIITNYNGYWSTTSTSNSTTQPDTGHSLMAFRYNGTLYSTGGEAEVTNVLASNASTTGTYTTGNWRALPIRNIAGNVPASSSSDPNLIVLASRVDGNPNIAVPTAPTVKGLSVRDVLIDGIRGLNIGTGVTNLPASSVLNFEAKEIVANAAGDAVPDIMVSQVADPSNSSFSVYCFVDSNGNIVGNPMQIALNSVTALGTYKTDFFTLPSGQPLNTAVVNGTTTVGLNTRPIRMVAYKLSDFGINESNKANVAGFKVMPSGTSDPAFMAYNRDSFEIPAPEIATQPQSAAVCPGSTATFSVTVTATGTELEYRWEKDGTPLNNGGRVSGATTATLQITGVTVADNGVYRCVVTNPRGSAFSNSAYLNTVVLSTSGNVATCLNTPAEIAVYANGNTPTYKWYSNTTNSNTGGTLIASATSSTYTPPATTAGTTYFYAEVYPAGYECAKTASTPIAYTVNAVSAAGTISGNQSVCPAAPATVSLTGYTGTIQWQSSTTGNSGSWTNINGATSASYTAPSITQITYFRAIVTNSTCSSATSATSTVSPITSFVWTGLVDRNWHVAGNWSCSTIPTLTDDVTIPLTPNQPIVSQTIPALGKSLTLQANATLTANSGTNLQILGAVTVDTTATLTLQNNANLVQDTATAVSANAGKITVFRDNNSLYRLDYTLWSSPVTGQNLFAFSPSTVPTRFYTYTTATDVYTVVPGLSAASTTEFLRAKAYLIRMPNTSTEPGYNNGTTAINYHGSFTGVPNNGAVYASVSTQGQRYNGIGNPYPSPINVHNFIDANVSSLADGTLYFWRKKNNMSNTSYATVTKFAYAPNDAEGGNTAGTAFPEGLESEWTINSGQGFIAKVASNATQIAFSNTMRRMVNTNQFFRPAAETGNEASKLWINITSPEQAFSTAVVGYSDTTTNGFDFGYDGKLMNNDEGVLKLYSLATDNKLAIQARSTFAPTDVVPMGYSAQVAGSYTIRLTGKTGAFNNGQQVYLKDNFTGTLTNLTQGTYDFVTEAGTFDGRFEVVYSNTVLSNPANELTANSVIIFKNNAGLYIDAGKLVIKNVELFDVRGRQVFATENVNSNATTITGVTAENQVLIARISTQDGSVLNKKVVY